MPLVPRQRESDLPPLACPAQDPIAQQASSQHLYFPGDVVSLPNVDMTTCIQGKGLGRSRKGDFIAYQLGTVERMNRMLMIKSRGGAYNPTIGDLIVGRITEVNYSNSSWSVAVGSHRPAQLPLGAVVLPCGTQRRRNVKDQLNMRELFDVNDVIIAEVQRVGRENQSMTLHTRSAKFGRLENGVMVKVKPTLIARSDQHLNILRMGDVEPVWTRKSLDEPMTVDGTSVFVVLGINGYIWIGSPRPIGEQDGINYAENAAQYNRVLMKMRSRIARVRAAVIALAENSCAISWPSLESVVEASCEKFMNLTVQQMYDPELRRSLLNAVIMGAAAT